MILVVGAEKGGVGKTAIATNLAALGAAEELEVLLLDTDPQGSSGAWSRIRNEGNISPSVSVLTVPENPIKELEKLAPRFDLVIIDVGAQNYTTMLNAVRVADLVLVPTGPDQLEVESTQNVFDALRSLDRHHKSGRIPAFTVLNNLPTNPRSKEEGDLRSFLAEIELPVFDAALRHRSSWRKSRRAGLAVHELRGRDADPSAASEMRAIFAEAERKVEESERS